MSIDIFVELNTKKNSYSVEEVAEMLCTTRQMVYKLIGRKVFESTKLKEGYRIHKGSFDKWLDNENEVNFNGINS